MKKIVSLLIVSAISASSLGANDNMKEKQWFQHFDCQTLQIVQYRSRSDNAVEKRITITDPEYIKSLQLRINTLPLSGDMMIEMGLDAGYLTLDFECNGEKERVEFYNSRIKTPSTSFYAIADAPERPVWEEIQSHFERPALEKTLPEVPGVKYEFDDFIIEYLGLSDRTPAGTTATLMVESFKVISRKSGREQIVEVKSGQLPPRPQGFKVDEEDFIVGTYARKDGTRISSRMFIVYRA